MGVHSVAQLVVFLAVLLDVELQMASVALNSDKELKAGGEFLFELLAKANLGFESYLPIYQVIDAAIGYLTSGGTSCSC